MAYQYGVKPQEFWDATYRDMKLYVESRSYHEELEIKNNIMLVNNLANKLIMAGVTSKKPKNIDLIKDVYSELFKKELAKQNLLHPKASEGEDLVNLMLELSEELKNTNNKDK